jgi:hypothetical protein
MDGATTCAWHTRYGMYATTAYQHPHSVCTDGHCTCSRDRIACYDCPFHVTSEAVRQRTAQASRLTLSVFGGQFSSVDHCVPQPSLELSYMGLFVSYAPMSAKDYKRRGSDRYQPTLPLPLQCRRRVSTTQRTQQSHQPRSHQASSRILASLRQSQRLHTVWSHHTKSHSVSAAWQLGCGVVLACASGRV